MESFRLRVKINGQEFEAEGARDAVCTQFQLFRLFVEGLTQNQSDANSLDRKHEGTSSSSDALPTQTLTSVPSNFLSELGKVVGPVPGMPHLICKVIPPGPMKEADIILLVLLGFRLIRNQAEVSVLILNQALKRSGCAPTRLDRILTAYTRAQLVLKSGKGKGGNYQLTNQGIKQAQEKALELARLLP